MFTILFSIAFVVLLVYLERDRKRWGRLADLSLVLLGLLVLQIALGELQHRTGLPWGLVLVHVALSAVVWAVTAVLVLLLFRPPISLARTRT